jgi:hypothetical protein
MHAYRGRYPLDHTLPWDSRKDGFLQYAVVYKDCIEFLMEHYEKKPPSHDYGMAPVLFLLRHYVELQLKGILISCRYDLKDLNHNIAELYKKTMKFVIEIYGRENVGNPDAEVEKFLLALGNFSQKGEAFRYPESKDGTPFSEKFKASDIWFYESITDFSKLRPLIKNVIDNIEGFGILLQELDHAKNEMEREMDSE